MKEKETRNEEENVKKETKEEAKENSKTVSETANADEKTVSETANANVETINETAKASAETTNTKKKGSWATIGICIIIIGICICIYVVAKYLIKYYNDDEIITSASLSSVKTSEGLNTYDKYDENAITIEEIEEEVDEATITYIQIDGLIDEEIENKINQEIEEKVYEIKNDPEKGTGYVYTNVHANYANVLSISYECTNPSDEGTWVCESMNYDLTTGEKIEFYDLFVSESAGYDIVYDSQYISLAKQYVSSEENIEYTDDYNVNVSEIKDELNTIMEYYVDNKIEEFYFDEGCICFWLSDEYDEYYYDIDMVDYLEDIAIYNRYTDVISEEIYEDPSISRKDIYVLTGLQDTCYEIREEGENYFIYLYIDEIWSDDDTEIYEIMEEQLKEQISEKANEIKNLAENSSDCYIAYYCLDFYLEDDDMICVTAEEGTYVYADTDWNSVRDEFLDSWRDGITPGYIMMWNWEGEGEDTYTWDENTFYYDENGEEIVLTDNEAEEELRFYTNCLVRYENFLDTYEDEDDKIGVSKNDSAEVFTYDGFEIYWQNAIEKGYITSETYYEEGEDDEEGWYVTEYYFNEIDSYQFGDMDLFLEDDSTYEIEITEKTAVRISANVTVKFFKDEDCKNTYEQASEENKEDELNLDELCDEYEIEIELARTDYESWAINNYSIL